MGSISSKPDSKARSTSKHRNRALDAAPKGYYDYNQPYLQGYWPAGTEATYGYPRPGVVPTYAAAVPQYPAYYPAHGPAPVVMPEPQTYVPPQPAVARPVIPTTARPPIQPEQAAANPPVTQPVVPPAPPREREEPKKRKSPPKKPQGLVISFHLPKINGHAWRPSAWEPPDNPLPKRPVDVFATSPYKHLFKDLPEVKNLRPTTSPTQSSHERRASTSAPYERPDNPLPKRPVDVFTISPYKHLLKDLPEFKPRPSVWTELDFTGDNAPTSATSNERPPPPSATFANAPASPMSVGTTYTSTSTSTSPPPSGGGRGNSSSSGGGSGSGDSPPRPIYFNQDTEHAGFLNHSPHCVSYERVTYPTATHLIEAMKYLPETAHNRGVAKLIRGCADLADVYRLSYEHRDKQHVEHGESYMEKMERVMYLKFNQHGSLADLLLSTGDAHLVYDDPSDSFWGVGGVNGEPGQNELGYMLEDIRAQLRRERTR